MNWSFKFAFDEMDELFNNRPWLLVDNELETKSNAPDEQGESFVSMQKQLMLERGWKWFSKVVRGRFFPNLNLTTLTTFEGEKHPEIGEPPEAVQRVREKFPGAALVSLIGGAHVIEGTGYVSPDILSALTRQASEQKWHQGFKKTAMSVKDLEKIIMSAWGVGAAGLAGWFLGFGISGQQIQQQIQQGASQQDVIRQVAPQNINGQPESVSEINFQPENPAPVSEINGNQLDVSPNIDNNVSQVVDLPSLIDRLIQTESSGDPQATSPRGARGLMQIMQPTWKEWSANVFGKELSFDKAYDPDLNQQVGTAYLKWIQETLRTWMDREPGVEHILSAYNGGIGRLRRLGFDVSKMPSESRNYVNKIVGQKQGSNHQTYHYAYQGTEWLQWKSQVIQWAKGGWDQTQIGQALAQNGVSRDVISKLIGEVVTPFLASAYAENSWNYKYV